MPARGRIPTYCSTRCRVAAHRARDRETIPAEMRQLDRWTRRDGKRPITTTGAPASSTDPESWSTFAKVKRSTVGNGLGVMLGGGLACYDFDHCLADGRLVGAEAAEVLRRLSSFYIEVSMSGDGLHAFVRAPERPGTKRPGVEFYSRARFIAVTGRRWEARCEPV